MAFELARLSVDFFSPLENEDALVLTSANKLVAMGYCILKYQKRLYCQ